ncbi:uncharacterized protein N7484_007799 [Penicillium longicatenatum]|uniref:uncharacterized protein n=1 Tax=Penicillium longicatenatum TaxID=1561947 RepID=UPI002546668E|nr:uncharacterized protein N7484_007799 [Penicillium longicatenatum]KAJ5639937.1 hypothetical protein N7484_007799 [Penicillium longicatenatum]
MLEATIAWAVILRLKAASVVSNLDLAAKLATTRIRRVKCGEEKPICLRCSSTGRKCEYAGAKGSSPAHLALHLASPSYNLLVSPNSTCHERRAFEYFVQHASKGLAAGMNVDFWTKVAPQICRTEPAVWDAIISISVLYEYPDQCLDFPLLKLQQVKKRGLSQIQREALTWYSRAISSIHSQIVRGRADSYVALISCVLFICIEAIQGRVVEALQLYEQGVSLILILRHQVATGTLPPHQALLLEKTIIPLFIRLGSISLTVSTVQVSRIFAYANYDLNSTFTSLDAARTAISVLFAQATLLEREAVPYRRAAIRNLVPGAEMTAKQQSLRMQLDHWLHAYTNFCQNHTRAEPVLLAYYSATSIYISTCLSQQELVYDSYMAEFAIIVENASLALAASGGPGCFQAPFTFEMGLGLPLFLTAIKCRHSRLRRKALKLLRQTPPIQAFFTCTPVAFVAQKCMELEEDYSRSIALAHDPQVCYPSPQSFISDLSSPTTAFEHESTGENSTQIPEEARICYHNVFRPQQEYFEGAEGENTIYRPNQVLEVFRNHFDTVSNTWRMISHCLPL